LGRLHSVITLSLALSVVLATATRGAEAPADAPSANASRPTLLYLPTFEELSAANRRTVSAEADKVARKDASLKRTSSPAQDPAAPAVPAEAKPPVPAVDPLPLISYQAQQRRGPAAQRPGTRTPPTPNQPPGANAGPRQPAAKAQPGAAAKPPADDAEQQVVIDPNGLVTMHTNEVDLRKLLEILSRQSGANILVSPKVTGTITANFEGVTVDQVLKAVIKLANLVEKIEGTLHYIYTQGELDTEAEITKREKIVTKVYKLNYVRSDEVLNMIRPFLSTDVGQKRVSVTPSYRFGISESATFVSGAGSGGSGGGASGGGGGGTSAGGGAGGASGGATSGGYQPPTGGNSMTDGDLLIVQDYESNLKIIDQIVARIDTRPVQVLIEAVIVSVDLERTRQLGVNFALVDNLGTALGTIGSGTSLNSNVGFNPTQLLTTAGQIAGSTTDPTGFASATNGAKFGFVANNVTGFIQALETIGSTKILASPRILVLNKQRAEIQLGSRLGFQTLSQNYTSTIQQVQFLNTGTLLRIRPFISDDGIIRMEIHPERSSGSVVNNIPNQQTAELTTNVMVPDGATLVIGGLMEDEDDYSLQGLPGLSRIPALGYLFGFRQKSEGRRELVVLLTPHVWSPDQAMAHGPLPVLPEGNHTGITGGLLPPPSLTPSPGPTPPSPEPPPGGSVPAEPDATVPPAIDPGNAATGRASSLVTSNAEVAGSGGPSVKDARTVKVAIGPGSATLTKPASGPGTDSAAVVLSVDPTNTSALAGSGLSPASVSMGAAKVGSPSTADPSNGQQPKPRRRMLPYLFQKMTGRDTGQNGSQTDSTRTGVTPPAKPIASSPLPIGKAPTIETPLMAPVAPPTGAAATLMPGPSPLTPLSKPAADNNTTLPPEPTAQPAAPEGPKVTDRPARRDPALGRASFNPANPTEGLRGSVSTSPRESNVPVASSTAPSAPGQGGTTRHTVTAGETFELIAQSEYGTVGYGRPLWWYNRARIAWPQGLKPGDIVVVPPVELLRSPPTEQSGAPEPAASATPRHAQAEVQPPAGGWVAAQPATTGETPKPRASWVARSTNSAKQTPATAQLQDTRATAGRDRPAGIAEREKSESEQLPTFQPTASASPNERANRRPRTDLDVVRTRSSQPSTTSRTRSRQRKAPVHVVREYETLRSIARDRLGNSRRADEIAELNQDRLTEGEPLTPGQVLILPSNAIPD
jgi:type IV pilus secretin PilQ/predicted competence protein